MPVRRPQRAAWRALHKNQRFTITAGLSNRINLDKFQQRFVDNLATIFLSMPGSCAKSRVLRACFFVTSAYNELAYPGIVAAIAGRSMW